MLPCNIGIGSVIKIESNRGACGRFPAGTRPMSPPEPRVPSGRKRMLVAIAGLGMLAYLGAALATDYAALERALVQLGWTGTALILGLSLLNYVLRFQRWHLYLRELGHRLPWGHHLLVYLAASCSRSARPRPARRCAGFTCASTACRIPTPLPPCSSSACWISSPTPCWRR
jgi:hypothetical protein